MPIEMTDHLLHRTAGHRPSLLPQAISLTPFEIYEPGLLHAMVTAQAIGSGSPRLEIRLWRGAPGGSLVAIDSDSAESGGALTELSACASASIRLGAGRHEFFYEVIFNADVDESRGFMQYELNVQRSTSNRAVDVRQYLAKGDGVTDDTRAIQVAIDDIAGAGGGTLFFPTGVYLVGTRQWSPQRPRYIELKSNVRLLGEGKGSIVKLGDEAEIPSSRAMLYGYGVENVTIEQLTLDGGRDGQIQDDDHLIGCVTLMNSRGCVVRDTLIRESRNNGVYLHGSSDFTAFVPGDHVLRDNVALDHVGTSYRVGQVRGVTVEGNTARDTRIGGANHDGFIACLWGSRDVTIANNVLETGPSVSMGMGVWLTHGESISVTGNTISGGMNSGVLLMISHRTTSAIESMRDVTISGNRIGAKNGIAIQDTVDGAGIDGLIISANTIEANGAAGIEVIPAVNHSQTRYENIVIADNVVRVDDTHAAHKGIHLASDGGVIDGNRVHLANGLADGVRVQGEGLVVIGNSITLTQVGATGAGVRVQGRRCAVTGNTIATAGQAGVKSVASSDFNVVTGNALRGGGVVDLVGGHNEVCCNVK